MRKTEAYARAGRGPWVSRATTENGFFASFGDFFPALWVPTISEHLLALSLLKRSAHLRDSKEKNARRDFRRTHVSQNFCPRAREYYAPQSYCIRFFIYTNYTLRDGDVSGTIGDFSRTNEQFIFLRRDGAAFDHFYWSEKCKRDVYSIQRRLRGIFCRLDRSREPTVVTDCWVVLPDGCLCDSVPCDGAETGFGFRDRRDMRGGFVLLDWHWDGVFCGRESEEFFRRR